MHEQKTAYKRELTDGLEKEAVAFLNYHDGGVIYLGIDKDGSVYGVPNGDVVQLAVKDRLKNNIQPSVMGLFDVIHEERNGKDVIRITLAGGSEKPYHLKKFGMTEKGCYIRVGSASEPMPSRMIEELFSKSTRNSLGRIRSPRQDLSFEQLRIYYEESGFELGDKFADNLELLTDEGLYNYAGYLLADQNGNSVQVAKYAGIDRVNLLQSKDYGFCCLIKTCKLVLDRLEGVENRVINKITSRERINLSLWDKVALREAVINAIIHNDYSNELVPKFEIFDDRLEITAAGYIHPGEEREDFFAGYSIPRNKILMRVFKDLGMVEYLGSGMPRILKAYPRENYIFSSHFIRTVFKVSEDALALEQEVMAQTGSLPAKQNDGTVGETVVKTVGKTEREKKRMTVHISALNRLFEAQGSDSFTDAWHFINRHFGELYSVKANVTELRKAILQLGVMGKLVPQDPNDQPASELLKEIEVKKRRLVKEGKNKTAKATSRDQG